MSKISKRKLLVYPLTLATFAAVVTGCNNNNGQTSSTTPSSSTSTSSSTGPISSTSSSVSSSTKEEVVVTIEGENVVANKHPLTLTATVKGVDDKSVTWSTTSNDITVVDGVVTTKGPIYEATEALVRATSVADPTVYVEKKITVAASEIVVTGPGSTLFNIKDRNVEGFDFKTLFSITVDGDSVDVTDDVIDTSAVKAEKGVYVVNVDYHGVKAQAIVNVEETIYKVEASQKTVTLKAMEVETYDFKSLFSVTMDGEAVEVTDDMVTSNVKSEVGDYTVTVEYHGASDTIAVSVIEDHEIEVLKAYQTYTLPEGEVDAFDASKLFTLVVDGKAVQVTPEMVVSTVQKTPGDYTVTLSYKQDSTSISSVINVKVVSNATVVLNAKDVVIYPDEERIDLKSLFEISVGGEPVTVTDSMVSGFIDYNKLGTNTITLSYTSQGVEKTATATVTIKTGLRIEYASSSVIVVKKGSVDTSKYNFAKDFVLISNGREYELDSKYLDTASVDFATAGSYTVTAKVPYTGSKVEGAAVTEEVTLSITYVVKESLVSIKVVNESLEISENLTAQQVKDNVEVRLNNIYCDLTEDQSKVANRVFYYTYDDSAVKLGTPGTYKVLVSIYVDGVDADPTVVSFDVTVPTKVVVSGKAVTVFEGSVVDSKSLFTVKDNGEDVKVTSDMVSGIVDVFTPGVYGVTLEYKGVRKTVDVIVLDKELVGTYSTVLVGSSTTEVNDDDTETTTTVLTTAKLTINADMSGSLTINNTTTSLVRLEGIDGESATVTFGSTDYTLSYDDGILSLIPVNAQKMQYIDSIRYYVMTKESKYEIVDRLTVNYGSNTLINSGFSSASYTIDALKVKDLNTNEVKWVGMKSDLIEKKSADYYYSHDVGEITLSAGYKGEVGEVATLTINGFMTEFTVTGEKIGKVNRSTSIPEREKDYVGDYTGKIYGKDANVKISSINAIEVTCDGKEIADLSISDVNSLTHGGIDYTNDIYYIYDSSSDTFALKIKLNVEAKTFEVLARDGYEGKYLNADGSYVFLDGYGYGAFKGSKSEYVSRIDFTYTIENGMVNASFINVKPSYQYGSYASFFVDNFRNKVVLADSDVASLVGKTYETETVEHGIKVDVSSYTINMVENASEAQSALLSYFTIVTADGEVSDKSSYVDYSLVDFTKKGFYLVTVSAEIDGVTVSKYYTFEVVSPVYEDNALLGSYTGANKSYSMSIDKFGNGTFKYDSYTYTGKVVINSDLTFSMEVTRTSGSGSYSITGSYLANGALAISATGDRTVTNMLFMGATTDGYTTTYSGYQRKKILRTITKDGVTTYIYSTSSDEYAAGQIVTVDVANGIAPNTVGSVFTIKDSAGEALLTAKITSIISDLSGLQLAGSEAGSYTVADGKTATIDGFGESSSKRGAIVFSDGTTYDYYKLNNAHIALTTAGSTTIVGYAAIDQTTKELIVLKNDKDALKATYGTFSYSSSVSTSSHQVILNEYGVGSYKDSNRTYYGYVTGSDAEGYVFHGETYSTSSSSTIYRVEITMTKVISKVFSASISVNGGTAIKVDLSANSGVTVSYIGSNYKNYIKRMIVGDEVAYFLYTTSSAAGRQVTVTALNDIAYGTAGCIFEVTDGDEVIIEKAMINTYSTTKWGYISANSLAGDYTVGDQTLSLDGFADFEADSTGVAKLGDKTGSYVVYEGTVISVTIEDNTVLYRLNTSAKSASALEKIYNGSLLGTYGQATTSSSTYVLSIDEYGAVSYGTPSGSTIYRAVSSSISGDLLNITLKQVGSTYTKSLVIAYVAPGVLTVVDGSDKNFYVSKDATLSVFAKVSSSANIIYKVVKADEVSYLYAPTNKTTVDAIATVTKTIDSTKEVGEVGGIFKLVAGDTEVVAKITSTGTIALANNAERISITYNGETLFTDGFTTSATARGNATLANKTYTYYFHPSLTNTVVLYDDAGTIADYITINGETFERATEFFTEEDKLSGGSYAQINSTTSPLVIDKYGYITYDNNFFGKLVRTETGYTAETSYKYNTTVRKDNLTITMASKDVFLVRCEGYDSGYGYYTLKSVKDAQNCNMIGKSWANLLYWAVVDGKVTFMLDKSHSYDVTSATPVIVKVNDVALTDRGLVVGDTFTVEDSEGNVLFTATVSQLGSGYSDYTLA